ncbi:MAG: hypothetical protein N2037_13450, partial [Acidimicrobiales bacterium]|nr:hypothetical protein [Acidimicrobiales bacterium]
AVVVDGSGLSFTAARSRVSEALRQRKNQRWLKHSSAVLAAVDDNRSLCESCGAEAGQHSDRLGDERETENDRTEEKIGDHCKRRREVGRKARKELTRGDLEPALSLNEVLGGERLLAAVYLDADRAGEVFASIDSADDLARVASTVQEGTQQALTSAINTLGLAKRVVIPVLGGDDVFVLCAASRAAELLELLWSELHDQVTTKLQRRLGATVTFSAGVAIAERFLPLRLLHDHAHAALREAKEATYVTGDEPHVVVRTVGKVRRSAPEGPVFGGPLPSGLWRGWGAGATDSRSGGPQPAPGRTLGELVRQLAAMNPSQRSGLLDDLAQESAGVRELYVDYRRAKLDEEGSVNALAGALETARQLADHVARRLGRGSPRPNARITSPDVWSVLHGGILACDLRWTND